MKECGPFRHRSMQHTRDLQDYWRSPVRKDQGTWNKGAGSGFERDRQARWDAQEMRTATTKVRREVYERFAVPGKGRKPVQRPARLPAGLCGTLRRRRLRDGPKLRRPACRQIIAQPFDCTKPCFQPISPTLYGSPSTSLTDLFVCSYPYFIIPLLICSLGQGRS